MNSYLKYCCLLCGCFCLLATNSFGQASADSNAVRLVQELSITSSFFATDKLGQIYIVEDDQLVKYSSSGDSLFQFNNHRNGELALVDPTDPFNVVLYYPEFLKVVTLDRTLSPTSEFDLYDLNIVDVPAIGMSNDNNMWIYDNSSFTLKKINRNGKLVVESENLSFQLDSWLQPTFILERGNFVFVNDPEQGIFIFDLFGKYIKTLEIMGLTDFQVENDNVIYQQESALHAFDLNTLNEIVIPLPTDISEDDQVQVQKDLIYVRKEGKVLVYKF